MFEGGSAQFAGAFIISISSIVPGGFYLATFALMAFLRRVINFLTQFWSDFWTKSKSWVRSVFIVIPKTTFWFYFFMFQSSMALIGYFLYAFMFFLMNRIARLDNLTGESKWSFKQRNGQAAKMAEYSKPIIKLLSLVDDDAETDEIVKR